MSPRLKGRRTIGAFVNTTPGGKLRLNFRWPLGQHGKLYRVTTDYRDAAVNRSELERVRDLVGAEIRAGTFVLATRFPSLVAPKVAPLEPLRARVTFVVERMREWIGEKDLRKVRRSRVRDYRSHLKNYFTASAIAERDPFTLRLDDHRALQLWLVSKAGKKGKGISEKTAQNVILGTLSAFLRDIGAVEAFAAIDGLVWERYEPKRKQDPLAPADRDKLLDYFRKKRPFAEYVSLRLRFRGLTPSEVRGLHVGDFDRMTATAKITRSEHLHHEGATKERARERVVLLGEVADDVATLCGLRDPDESFVVVAEDTLRDNFTKAQKALGIRHRSLYQAKHTFAVLSLLGGESPAVVARNLGISLATLERHYAASLQKGRTIAMENAVRASETPRKTPRAASGGKSTREIKRPRRDLALISRGWSRWNSAAWRETKGT